MAFYRPRSEPAVLLKCGCIVTRWGSLFDLTKGHYFNDCWDHGWQKEMRKPTMADHLKFIRKQMAENPSVNRYQNETLF